MKQKPVGADEIGVLPSSTVFAMTGLEFLTRMREGRFPHPPIALPMRMRLIEVDEGRIVFVSWPDAGLMNPIGTVHGGYAMTLLDSCMGCAVHSTCSAGEAYTTIEAKVNLVRPILPETGEIRAEGYIVHRGRSIATAEGRLTDQRGKLLAHASTTCSILPMPAG